MFVIFSIMMVIRNLMMMMFAPTTQLAVSGSRPSLHMDLRLAKAVANIYIEKFCQQPISQILALFQIELNA